MRLSLGELRSLARFVQSVLLTLFGSWVAGEVAFLLEDGSVRLAVCDAERSCYAVADSARLSGKAAAADVDEHVILVLGAGGNEGLIDDQLHRIEGEVFLKAALVDDDIALTCHETHSCDSGLSSAGAEILNFLGFFGSHNSPLS